MKKTIRIGIVAGEASGDLLAAHLILALKERYPNIEFIGIAGPKMIAAGCKTLYPQERLAVRGFVEVIKRLREILNIRRGLVRQLILAQLDVFIGVDAPDFNFTVEKKLKQAGIPTIHYVSPSVWAWRPKRVHNIVKIANRVLCLFPIEPQLYIAAGGQADFVGHPLAQTIPLKPNRALAREKLNISAAVPVFALLPGSRVSEIEFMAKTFLDTAKLLLKTYPQAQFILPLATVATAEKIRALLQEPAYSSLPILLLDGDTQTAVIAADVVLVTSGTATLEVALCKRPMVISYKVSALTFKLVKSIYQLPFVGLPNVLLNRFAVPELLQNEANPMALAQALCDWYDNPAKIAQLEADFTELHLSLKQDTATLAANAVFKEIKSLSDHD